MISAKHLFIYLLIAAMLPLGCGKTILPPREKIPEKKKKYSKATQRPYVIRGIKYYPIPSAVGYREPGLASWYGKKFHGRKTSNGETYDMYGNTAAHKTLPMNTMLLVKNLENGKSTVVRINDRGPFVKDRIIDLTHTGAKEIGMLQKGTARVEIIAMAAESDEKQKTAATPLAAVEAPTLTPKQQDFDKGKFYVQTGAFEFIENARKLAKKFASTGRDVVIQQYPAAGMHLYRVLVYSGTSLRQAKQYEQYLEKRGFPNALVLAR